MGQGDGRLNVLKIWDAEYPWDVRAEKVCQALTDGGHPVLMVARNRDGRPTREQLPECEVLRMGPLRGVPPTLESASQFPAFLNPRWARLIQRGAESHRADVLLVRDLPLAPTAAWVGQRIGIPVILDMAENYPAMMRDLWLTGAQGPLDWIVRNPRIVRLVEEWSLPRMDHILVVVEESKTRLVEMGLEPSKITVVGNTPPSARMFPESRERPSGESAPRAVYLGLIEEARGIRTFLEAVAICRSMDVNVEADVIGAGRHLESMIAFAERAGLEGRVKFHGFVPHEQALEIVAGADWGVIPHHANEAWNTTIPNKLFDYMAVGVAVAASDCAPVKRVVSETGCGAVFPDRDAAALARVLAETSSADRWRLGEAGRRSVMEKYHWEKDSKRLVDAVVRVSSGGAGSAGAPPKSPAAAGARVED